MEIASATQVNVESLMECAELCHQTPGCLAANAVTDDEVMCEMAQSLQDLQDISHDPSSAILVQGQILLDFESDRSRKGFDLQG